MELKRPVNEAYLPHSNRSNRTSAYDDNEYTMDRNQKWRRSKMNAAARRIVISSALGERLSEFRGNRPPPCLTNSKSGLSHAENYMLTSPASSS